jgi:hypothetical protein
MHYDTVELIPETPQNSVSDRIRSLVQQSEVIRGLISFWSISHRELGDNFIPSISNSGYICADIHTPTNIDRLNEICRRGGNVNLHLFKASGRTETRGTLRVPPHLMHSKTFIFDLRDKQAAIWIGSHNATIRALKGVNIETSVLIHTHHSSDIYRQTSNHLDSVQKQCHRMRTNLLNYYKWLQGESNDKEVIEFNDTTNKIKTGDQFALFLTVDQDTKQVRRVGKLILLSFTNLKGIEKFFWGEIGQSGELSKYPKVSFSIKKYAIRSTRKIPDLIDCAEIPKEEIRSAAYFVVFTIRESLSPNSKVVEVANDRWITAKEIPLYTEEDAEDYDHIEVTSRRQVRAVIQKAISPSAFRQLERNAQARQSDNDRNLVTRITIIDGDSPAF